MIEKCPFCEDGIMKTIDLSLRYWTGTRYGQVRETIEAFECENCGWIAFKRKEA